MSWHPHEAPYSLLWRGAWRPVTWMGVGRIETDNPLAASAAVLYLGRDEWTAVEVSPGEIVRNPEATDSFLTIEDDRG